MNMIVKRYVVGLLALVLLLSNVVVFAAPGTEVIIMPASLQTIEEEAFYNNTSIRKIVIQEGTIEICSKAFANCSSLESVILPESLVRIEAAVFENCNALEKINLPEGIEFIGERAFDSCPNVVITVVEFSYADNWCKEAGIRTMYFCDDENGLGWG